MSDTSMQDSDGGELWTVGEAREYLKVSTNKMVKMLRSGVLPYERDPLDGRIRLVKRAHVEALARFHQHAVRRASISMRCGARQKKRPPE